MRMSARSLGAVALAIAVLIGGAWWMTRQTAAFDVSDIADPPVPGAAIDASTSPAFGESPFADDGMPRATLPPASTPLDRLWSTLQGPAQAGDARAACRLAIETIRCVNATRFASAVQPSSSEEHGELRTLIDFEQSPSSFGGSGEPEDTQTQVALEGFSAQLRATAQRCEGVSQERATSARALLRAAALAGQPDAQAVYAAGEGWFLSIPGSMASPEFDQWRSEAPLIVARMLDAGHPDAPGLLAGAYSDQTWLAGLYDYDIERAAAYLTLSTRLMGKPEMADRQLRGISSAARSRARQQADVLYARHYEGRNNEKAHFWLGVGVRITSPMVADREITPAPCEPPSVPSAPRATAAPSATP